MVSFQFKFDLASTNYDAPLGFRCRLNNVEVYTINHVQTEQSVQVEIPDTEDEKIHHISFELFGKTIDDTKVDEQGQILADSLLLLSNFTIDDIKVDYPVQINTVYHHDFNGSQSATESKFYGPMGCNGQAIFKFTTPIFLWLLDNS